MPTDPGELPELDPVFWRVVDDGLSAIRLDLPTGARAAIDGHVRLLVAWNTEINLTALRSAEQIARGHVLDSLISVSALRSLLVDAESLLDIGAGGGFPGLPLAAMMRPGRAALVESIGKKARFLEVAAKHVREAVAADNPADDPADNPPDLPQIEVLARRAEDVAAQPGQRESWQVVTARAVGTLAEVAELGLPLTRREGYVAAWKLDAGDGSLAKEIEAARRICQACGGSAPVIVRLEAADRVGLSGHCLVTIKKVRATPDRYPRPPSERRRSE